MISREQDKLNARIKMAAEIKFYHNYF